MVRFVGEKNMQHVSEHSTQIDSVQVDLVSENKTQQAEK